ncbi:MAG: site-specific integrase [Planctomycetales bacterium]
MDDSNKYESIGEIVSIFRRGAKWYANFQLGGKQRRKSLKTASKKEARRRALLLEAEILEGRYQHLAQPPTIRKVIDAYLKYARTEGRTKRTVEKYEHVFELARSVAEELGKTNILQIDQQFIDEYRHRRVAAGRRPKTVYNETMLIRQLVNFALTRKMIGTDPLAGIKLKEPKPRPQPCWSPEEVAQILATAKEPQRSAFVILAETGMRIGELQWLTWGDVDFERNLLHVREKDGWKPKTGDQRAVPMSPALRTALERLPRRGPWVVTAAASAKYADGDGQISERRLLRSLKRVLTKLGLKGHLHTFRHSFISRALLAGIPEAVVREWVGHVDRDILKLYTHVANRDSQSAMRRLAQATDSENGENGKEVPRKNEPADESE